MSDPGSSVWASILETARFAPSPHNVQPWKVKILSDQAMEVFVDRSRTLPDEDPTGSFVISAMAMFVEAIRLVGENHGHRITAELHDPDVSEPLALFARLSVEGPSPGPSRYPDSIFLVRRTSRLPSITAALPPSAIASLDAVARAHGQRFVHLDDPGLIAAALDRNVDALFDDLNDAHYHDEISLWFRCSAQSARRHPDGLDFRCMRMSPMELAMAKYAPWVLKAPVIGRMMRALYRQRLGAAHHIGLIAGPFWSREDAVPAGRFLLTFWLELASKNLFLHPFGNLVTNRAAAAWLKERTGVSDVWLVFRFGETASAPRSARLPLEELLVG